MSQRPNHHSIRLSPTSVTAVTEISRDNGGNLNRAVNQLIEAGHQCLTKRWSYKRCRNVRDRLRAAMQYDQNAAKFTRTLLGKAR